MKFDHLSRPAGSTGSVSRRTALGALVIGAAGVTAAACSSDKGGKNGGAATPKPPVAKVSYAPEIDSADASPVAKIAAKVEQGTLGDDVKLTNARGKLVKGELSADRTEYTITEPLGYGVKYTWSGTATGSDMKTVPLQGAFTVVNPENQVNVVVNIADGQSVGIAAPLILKFDSVVQDKKAVEEALAVTTTPKTEGSWAWLPEDGGSRAHWRTKEYFAPGTKVSMTAKLYGLNHGAGAFGAADVTSNFVIGRAQVVKAEASSHQIVVVRDGATLMTLPCSYGGGDLDRNVTRSGVHIVQEKHDRFYMSNPAAGYFNILERYAVRISNNGEFIHANPETVGVQGQSNVTNGCINLSLSDAQRYYETAVFGDPVEVTGTRIQLSAADGDIYDWVIDWPTWKSMSALDGDSRGPGSAPATPKDAPSASGTSTTPPQSGNRPPG